MNGNLRWLLLIVPVCGGCNALMGSLAAQVPSVGGRWMGRVVRVEVYDDRGRAFEAAALDVVEGPSMWAGGAAGEVDVGEARGGGTKPLLAWWHGWCRLIDPSTLPMGERVVVRGKMMVVGAALDRGREVFHVPVSRERSGGVPEGEHVIVVEGSVKVER